MGRQHGGGARGKRPRQSRASTRAGGIGSSSSSGHGGSGGGQQRQQHQPQSQSPQGLGLAGLAELGNALLQSFLLPLGPLLIDRRLNPGFLRESDTPLWWALALLAFNGGQWLACALRARASSWHLYMNRPPRRRATRTQLTALAGLVASIAATGFATRLGPLFLARFLSGFWAVFLWGHARERASKGGPAAGTAGLAAAGRWSNNRILPQQGHGQQQKALGEEGPLVNPLAALGTILGGLIGGLAFPTRTAALVGGRPALLPSLLAALCALLLGCLVLRRLNKELAALGTKNNEGPSRLSHEDLSASSSPFTRKDAASSSSPSAPSTPAVSIEMGPLAAASASSSSSHGPPPPTFLQACKGDAARAAQKWAASLAWRAREGVDGVLGRPHPHFEAIKEFYPHCVHGRSLRGEIVVYEFPGRMDLGRLKARGVGAAEIGWHYTFFMEFLFRRLTRGDEGRVMTVLDIGGLGLGTLSKDVVDVLRTTAEIMNNHYPERVTRICVVNAPFFAGAAWRVLQAVLPQSVQDKIELTADPGPGLRKYIAPEHIPACYEGTSPLPLFESEEERLLREVVAQANANANGGGNGDSALASVPVAAAPAAAPSTPVAPSTPTPTTTTPADGATPSNGNGGSSGGWLPALWGSGRRQPKGPQQAHLGFENRFVFDQQRRIWVLEEEGDRPQLQPHTTPLARPTMAPLLPLPSSSLASPSVVAAAATPQAEEDEDEAAGEAPEEDEAEEEEGDEEEGGSRSGGGGGGKPVDEEDGLILAIQAAHYAERLAREGRDHPSSLLLAMGAEADAEAGEAMGLLEGGGDAGATGGGGGGGGADAGAGLTMLMQTALVYALWAGLEGAVHAVLPVWMAAPHHLGGLGAKARGSGLLLALGAAACLALHIHGPHHLLRLPWAAPLHAFRLAVTAVVAAALGLSLHPRASHFGAWLLYAALLTGLVAALAVGRAAAAVLLDMAARAHAATARHQHHHYRSGGGGGKGNGGAAAFAVAAALSAPSARGLQRLRDAAGRVVGPFVGAALLSYGMTAGLSFPSDARLPFEICGLGAAGLYMLTLQLRVRVAGDAGHLSLDSLGADALAHNRFAFERRRRG